MTEEWRDYFVRDITSQFISNWYAASHKNVEKINIGFVQQLLSWTVASRTSYAGVLSRLRHVYESHLAVLSELYEWSVNLLGEYSNWPEGKNNLFSFAQNQCRKQVALLYLCLVLRHCGLSELVFYSTTVGDSTQKHGSQQKEFSCRRTRWALQFAAGDWDWRNGESNEHSKSKRRSKWKAVISVRAMWWLMEYFLQVVLPHSFNLLWWSFTFENVYRCVQWDIFLYRTRNLFIHRKIFVSEETSNRSNVFCSLISNDLVIKVLFVSPSCSFC